MLEYNVAAAYIGMVLYAVSMLLHSELCISTRLTNFLNTCRFLGFFKQQPSQKLILFPLQVENEREGGPISVDPLHTPGISRGPTRIRLRCPSFPS
jgi:hypothetical protein